MKFDILGLAVLLLAIIFLAGASKGSQLHQDSPQVNATAYADEAILVMAQNNASQKLEAKMNNQTGRVAMITHDTVVFINKASYQTYGMGIEFGFENSWVPPIVFALGMLALGLFYFLNNNFNVIAIVIALGVIAVEWVRERLAKG